SGTTAVVSKKCGRRFFGTELNSEYFIETGLTPKSEKKFGKHPTQKPEKLIQHFVEILSHPNDLIIDPFMGSGTTAVVSKKCGRRFFGTELNSEYF
ncbi:DNA methyltransferase, partial [Bacillus sp. D-CC]